MPHRPLSAYNLFFKDRHASSKSGGLGYRDLTRAIGTEWNGIDEQTKAPYLERAALDMERYQREVAAWRETQPKPRKPSKIKKTIDQKGEDFRVDGNWETARAGNNWMGEKEIKRNFDDHDYFSTLKNTALVTESAAGEPTRPDAICETAVGIMERGRCEKPSWEDVASVGVGDEQTKNMLQAFNHKKEDDASSDISSWSSAMVGDGEVTPSLERGGNPTKTSLENVANARSDKIDDLMLDRLESFQHSPSDDDPAANGRKWS